jgi:hypothetical protein
MLLGRLADRLDDEQHQRFSSRASLSSGGAVGSSCYRPGHSVSRVAQPSDLGALPRFLIVRAHHQNWVPRSSRSLRRAGTMLPTRRFFHSPRQKETPLV